nr:LPP leucine zipper domain-containing protein [Klebsiella sp.]
MKSCQRWRPKFARQQNRINGMNRKLFFILPMTLLTGCTNTEKLDQLTADIQTLNGKIAQLQQDINALHPEISAAKVEVEKVAVRLNDAVRWPDGILSHPPR